MTDFTEVIDPETGEVLQTASAPAPSNKTELISVEPIQNGNSKQHQAIIDYTGIGVAPFSEKAIEILSAPIDSNDVEIRPDGIVYLPEIKYRRRLNSAFGPGGWGLRVVEYGVKGNTVICHAVLYANGRYVSEVIGEQEYVSSGNVTYATAAESARSNALMRTCKDLGIASELWDPQYIAKWKKENAICLWCQNVKTNQKRQMWRKPAGQPFTWPWKEQGNAELATQDQQRDFFAKAKARGWDDDYIKQWLVDQAGTYNTSQIKSEVMEKLIKNVTLKTGEKNE